MRSCPDPAESSSFDIELRNSPQRFNGAILKNGRKEEGQKGEEAGEKSHRRASVTQRSEGAGEDDEIRGFSAGSCDAHEGRTTILRGY